MVGKGIGGLENTNPLLFFTGHHIIIPITGGRPDLGRFQTIYYAEFDGRREKEIIIKIVGE